MKKQLNKAVLFLLFIFTTIISCSESENIDTTPPGILSNISVTPTNGGGIISYSLPSDDDILYVKAVYTNSQGEEVFRVSSKHNTSIEVNGLSQSTPVNVKLLVVDLNENISEIVAIEFTPLESFIFFVQESIQIAPDLGGVKITWENIASKTVFVSCNKRPINVDLPSSTEPAVAIRKTIRNILRACDLPSPNQRSCRQRALHHVR